MLFITIRSYHCNCSIVSKYRTMRPRKAQCLLWLLSQTSILLPSIAFSTTTQQNKPWMADADRAVDVLKDAKSILFVTGAGISAESGLPTYRGVSGLYNDGGSAVEEDGMSIEECLSGSTYKANPALTWKYLLQIERACRGAKPSRAHQLLAASEEHIPKVAVMTQNIDGLHQRAKSRKVLSLHGNLHRLECSSCGTFQTVDSYAQFDEFDKLPPSCAECGGPIRPAVVLFDEYLGDDTVSQYENMLGMPMMSLMWTWGADRPRDQRPYDASISIGTSALFAYVNAAALSGKHTIEINPCETNLSHLVDVQVSAGATEALEYIFSRLGWNDHSSK